MAGPHQGARRSARRLAGVLCALLVVGALATPAHAGLKQRLDAAKSRLTHLRTQIERQQTVLDQLSAQAAALADKLQAAQGQLELITEQLMQTRGELGDVRDRYDELQAQLNGRLRQTYMNGPVSSLEFLLGASTFADLSDRMEYVNALAATDNDLALQVENLRNQLAAQARAQQRLQQKQTILVNGLDRDKAALDAKLAQQKQVYDGIQANKAEAVKLVAKLGKQYRQYLSSLTAVPIAGKGVFRVCPVDQPRAVSDGFGAPRYSGGYHPHAGDDIMAPLGTPIRAPFDGTAYSSYNTLGGNAVYVKGSLGYVYNAHLDRYSDKSNGPVRAGDVIGYVGWTGDAFGGVYHDHFEWHPYNTPSPDAWPKSPYGYSVIDTGSGVPAVNPYPLLSQVC
jgi:murein DD-endopeptidase MepM/ murein hydrolase activator NlpD